MYGSKQIGNLLIDRTTEKNKILVTFQIGTGITEISGRLIEIDPSFPTGYNSSFSSVWTIQCNDSGTTQIKEDNTELLVLPNYVDNYYRAGTWDNAAINAELKKLGVDVTKLFYDTGRSTGITWDNFEITADTSVEPNAASGVIAMNFRMISGNYFENGRMINAATTPKDFKTTISTAMKRPITGTPSQGEVIVLNQSDVAAAFKGVKVDGKYAYQVAQELVTNNIATEIVHLIKNDPSILLKNLNDKLSTDAPYTSTDVFSTLDESYFTVFGNNKEGKIMIRFGGFEVNAKYVYNRFGFTNVSNLTIPDFMFEIKIQDGQGKLAIARPFEIASSYYFEGVSNLSASDYINNFDEGDVKKFLYEEILWPQYQNFYDPSSYSGDSIFIGLNQNYNPINTLSEFENWLSIDLTNMKNNGSSLTGISLNVRNNYFTNDRYYTWADNAFASFEFSVDGFGSKAAAINWPIYVGIGVGVLGALSICLLIFAWVRHKNKRLRFEQ